MNKVLTVLAMLLVSLSCLAYDFTGKTFRGTVANDQGAKATITYRFKANHRASASMTTSVSGTQTDNNIYWEVSGDHINLTDGNGFPLYLMIMEEDGKVFLRQSNDYGNYVLDLHEVKGSSTGSKSKVKGKIKR